ncbi:MAG: hypothetical protein AB7O52_09900 [Planctomycetota bacterium]
MLDRVFAATDVECHCALLRDGEEPQPTPIVRISRTKAVVDWTASIAVGAELEFDLTVAPGGPLRLRGRVVHSGEMGLFVEWLHTDERAASRLQTRLVESASLERPRRRATDPPSAGAPPKPVPTPPRTVAESAKDVGERLLRHAKTVRSSDLAAARENVQVLDMATLTGLIQGAVDEAVATLQSALGDAERKRLLEEAEENFKARLAAFQAEKHGMESKAKHLQTQLDRAQQLLTEERLRLVSADQFTMSHAGIQELDERLSRILERALRGPNISPAIEEEMRTVVARLLDGERDKISAKEREAQSDALNLLERKVGRLAKALEETQKARERAERRAQALESAGTGIRTVMEAGLADDDPARDQKLTLLKDLFESNRKVRQQMEAAGYVAPTIARPRLSPPTPSDGANDGVKKITAPTRFTPPPLQRTRQKQPDGDEGPAADDPDETAGAADSASDPVEELS